MTKEEVQQRVLQDGKPLDLDKFTWDEKSRCFSTDKGNLVVDFNGINSCIFTTGSNCTFTTGSDCTFTTGSDCIFTTGSDCIFKTSSYCTFDTSSCCTFTTGSCCTFKTISYCTFKTGSSCTFTTGYCCTFKTISYCTFNTSSCCTFDTGSCCTFKTGYDCTFNTSSCCTFDTGSECIFKTGSECIFKTDYNCIFKKDSKSVIIKRDVFQIIQPGADEIIQLYPSNMIGYLSNGYPNGDESLGKHIIADGIVSKIVKQKGSVYTVINHGETEESYLIEKNGIYSHGKTIQEAKDSLVYKLANRDTSMYNNYTLDTKLTKDDAIVMYMTITGACQHGTRQFVESQDIPDELTVSEVIDITRGRYGNESLVKFMEKQDENRTNFSTE